MKVIAAIPARYSSTRFPGKLLKKIGNKSVLNHVFERVSGTGLFDDVIIATDDNRIHDHAADFGANVVLTSSNHKSGTDRIGEACESIDFDIVVNVQGDEPFISNKPLEDLILSFADKSVLVSTLITRLDLSRIHDPNVVKVVISRNLDALYFSRSAIPYNRDSILNVNYFQHIGVYAFRREALYKFIKLPSSDYENTEKLEQLRLLENGYKIKTVLTDYNGIGIDTEDDLQEAIKQFSYQSKT